MLVLIWSFYHYIFACFFGALLSMWRIYLFWQRNSERRSLDGVFGKIVLATTCFWLAISAGAQIQGYDDTTLSFGATLMVTGVALPFVWLTLIVFAAFWDHLNARRSA